MLGHRKLEVPDYVFMLKRRWWIVAAPALLLTVAAVICTYFIQPRYKSQTLVLIDQQKVPGDIVKAIINDNDLDSRLATMKEQITSRSRIQPLIQKYNLYSNSGMNLDDKIDAVRKDISIEAIRSQITRTNGLPGFFISYTASDPRTAQLVCQEITSLFVNENLGERESQATSTTAFLESQLADAKRSLDDQDAKLAAFQHEHSGALPDESPANQGMLNSLNTQLEAANQSLTRLEEEKTFQDSIMVQMSPGSTPSNAPVMSLPNPARATKQAQLDALLKEQDELTAQYTADYPDVVANRKKIAEVRKELAALPATVPANTLPTANTNNPLAMTQMKAQMKALEQAIAAKRAEQGQLEGQIRTYQGRIASTPDVEQQYKALTRDYETAKQFYDSLLTKQESTKMAADLEIRQEGEQFRVMDPANLPDAPLYPKRGIFAAVGAAAGLLLGLGIVALFEYRDTALRSERDVWAFTNLPTLAVIALARNNKKPADTTSQEPRPPRTPKTRRFGFGRKKPAEGSLAGAHG